MNWQLQTFDTRESNSRRIRLIATRPDMDEELKAKIEDLPSELYNKIRDEVLVGGLQSPKPDCLQFIYIEDTYQYPNILKIDRYNRKEAAKKLFTMADFRFTSIDIFRKFYTTLDSEFLKLINRFTIMYASANGMPDLVDVFRFNHYMINVKRTKFRLNRAWPGEGPIEVNGKTLGTWFILEKEDEQADAEGVRHEIQG